MSHNNGLSRKRRNSEIQDEEPPTSRSNILASVNNHICDENEEDNGRDSVSPITLPDGWEVDENGRLVCVDEQQEEEDAENRNERQMDALDFGQLDVSFAVGEEEEAEENEEEEDMTALQQQQQQQQQQPLPPQQQQQGSGNERRPEINIRDLYTYELMDEESWKDVVKKKRYRMNFSAEIGNLSAENHELYAMALMDMASRVDAPQATTRMGITITPKGGDTLYVHPRSINQFSSNFLEAEMGNILQSSREINAPGNELEVTLTFLEGISGSGRRQGVFPIFRKLAAQPALFQQTGGNVAAVTPLPSTSSDPPTTLTERRRGTYSNNVESYCLGTAIARGIAHVQLKEDNTNQDLIRKVDRWKKLRGSKPTVSSDCWQDAKNLLRRAGITKSTNFTIDDVRKVQQILRGEYQLLVINNDHDPQPVYVGEYVSRTRSIPLLYNRGHFELIFSLPRFVGCSFYCTLCCTRDFAEKSHYKCPLKCVKCLSDDCPRTGTDNITCADCGIRFPLKACFDRHKLQGLRGGASRCSKTKICRKCKQSYYSDRGMKHVCGTAYCQACQSHCEKGHTHTLAVKPPPRKFSEKRIFFDLETMEVEEDGLKKHKVVLACALRCCPDCRNDIPKNRQEALQSSCENCSSDGQRYREFDCFDDPNTDPMEEFVQWLLNVQHVGFVVLAHNLKGFDGQILLQYALKPHIPKPSKLIMCGRKINLIEICGMRLIDSFNFVPFGLAKFSKAFDVPEITKGEFPFRFIKRENFGYTGPMPDKEYYGFSEKNKASKAKFQEFYDDKLRRQYVFDFKRDIRDYCFSDVALLAAAMVKFELGFLEKTQVMLFEEAVTSAGAAITTFQRNFVRPGTMALDTDPSSTRIKQSGIARRFIAYMQTLENNQIQCVDNIGEYKIPGTRFHVDGFVDKCPKYPRGKAIEFYGCYFHAHSCLYSSNQVIRGIDRAIDIRQRDAERETIIRQHCDLEIFWECEVMADARSNKKLANMLNQNISNGPVICREALFGGRTEVIRLFLDAARDRELFYLDFTSLYPYVMKNCQYPVGQGKAILGSQIQCPITTASQLQAACKGYMSCKVIPPSRLFIPVLPYRTKKLLFTLCRTCGEEGKEGACPHTDEERALFGTWTTVELELALRKGYVIAQVYGAVHWNDWTTDLFRDYINTFLREKQEASGWPSWATSDADRRRYIDDYEAKEGVVLDFQKIKKDEVTRQVSKLLLNSLWGKFGQRVDTVTTHIVTSASALYRLMNNPTLEISHVEIHNEASITVQTRAISGTLQPLKTSCIQYAILTTAHARCKLYDALDRIPNPEKNLAYMDTDSIIFAADRSDGNPLAALTGEYLGELTSELSGEMKNFVTVGPKSYAYKEILPDGSTKVCVKAKGFSMNADAERKIDYSLMRKQVDDVLGNSPNQTETVVRYQTIKRTPDHTLVNVEIEKKFKFTFNKRQIVGDGATLPFGFERA